MKDKRYKGGQSTLKKYGYKHFQEIAKKRNKSVFGDMTDEQKSDYMRCVRMKQFGWKWNKEKKECEKPDLGVAFSENIIK